jgi:hypothetical protein
MTFRSPSRASILLRTFHPKRCGARGREKGNRGDRGVRKGQVEAKKELGRIASRVVSGNIFRARPRLLLALHQEWLTRFREQLGTLPTIRHFP